jgi:hypothetical protein
MSLNLGRRSKNFASRMIDYAKAHPWKTAAILAAGAFGLLLIAAGVVLTATAPATFGGGAAVGIPLLGVGTGLAAGFVLIAAGVVTTGCATGYFWSSAKTQHRKQTLQVQVDTIPSKSRKIKGKFRTHHLKKTNANKKPSPNNYVNSTDQAKTFQVDGSTKTGPSLWKRQPKNDKKISTTKHNPDNEERNKPF